MSAMAGRSSEGQYQSSSAPERVVIPIGITTAALILGGSVAMHQWLVAALVLALPLVFLWPVQVSLGGFALLIPFDGVSVLGQAKTGTTLTFVAGGAATLVVMCAALVGNRLTAPPRAALWWTLFVGWGVASASWALNPELSWQRVPTSLACLLMFLVTVSLRMSPRELSWIERCTITGGVLAAVYSMVQFYSGAFYHGTLSMRGSMIAGGREEDPNQFAVTLLLPVALAFGRYFATEKRLEKGILMMAVGIISLGVFITMSRGTIIALMVIMVFFAYRLRTWRICVPVILLGLLYVLLPNLFFDRLRGAVASRAAGRIDIWIAGLQAAWHYGVWGAGLDNFPTAYTDVAGAAPVFSGFAQSSHNIYLGMLVELGVVGFVCFLYALRAQLRDASQAVAGKRKIPPYRLLSYQAACYGMLANGLSLDVVWRKSFWLCWILLAAATALEKEDADDGLREARRQRERCRAAEVMGH